MKKLTKIIAVGLVIVNLNGCAALGAIGSLAGGLFGGGGSGNSTNSGIASGMTLNTQVGDNAAKKTSVDADKIAKSKVAGNDQENYTASNGGNVVINKTSFWDTIGFMCFGFVVCLLIMWHLPQPKYVGRLKAKLNAKKEAVDDAESTDHQDQV
jgi:hypothetical protein